MIPIRKKHPPTGLLRYKRESSNPAYIEFSESKEWEAEFDELRESLVAEQGYICCYCQQKVAVFNPNGAPQMKTEHFLPKDQNKYPEYQLDYGNLLGSCLGNSNTSKRENHCDSSKSNQELVFLKNPANEEFQLVLDYQILPNQGEVRVVPASPHKENEHLQRDIKVLNLNELTLRHRRFTVWKHVLSSLGIDYKQTLRQDKKTLRLVRESIEAYEPNSNKRELKEFCGFIFAYLNKRFRSEL